MSDILDTDAAPSGAYSALSAISPRSRTPGHALGCLRRWRALHDAGADDTAREAALAGLSGPVTTDPLSKEQ